MLRTFILDFGNTCNTPCIHTNAIGTKWKCEQGRKGFLSCMLVCHQFSAAKIIMSMDSNLKTPEILLWFFWEETGNSCLGHCMFLFYKGHAILLDEVFNIMIWQGKVLKEQKSAKESSRLSVFFTEGKNRWLQWEQSSKWSHFFFI